MQINNLLSNFIKQNMPRQSYEENSIIEGKLISLENGIVTLEVEGEILMAKTDIDLSQFIGENIDFIVDEKVGNKIIIKPVTEETIKELSKDMETTINKTIKEFSLPKEEKVEDLIGKFISDKMPLNKENVENGVRLLKKIDDLFSNADKEVEVIETAEKNSQIKNSNQANESETSKSEENISKDISSFKLEDKPSSDKIKSEKNPLEGLKDSEEVLGKENPKVLDSKIRILNELMDKEAPKDSLLDIDIKNIIVKNHAKTDGAKVNHLETTIRTLSYKVENEDMVKITKFFIKNDIKPSLNNIKYSLELIKEPKVFAEGIKTIVNRLEREEFFEKDLGIDLESVIKSKDGDKKLKELIKGLDIPKETKQELIDSRSRLQFIRDLNKEMYFQAIPLKYGENGLDGFLSVIKEKESKFSGKKPISIFINLDTNNIGNISIACLAFNKDLGLKMGIERENEDLFRSLEPVLKNRIGKLGYNLTKLEYTFDNDIKAIENIEDSNSIYFLDIKV